MVGLQNEDWPARTHISEGLLGWVENRLRRHGGTHGRSCQRTCLWLNVREKVPIAFTHWVSGNRAFISPCRGLIPVPGAQRCRDE